MLNNLSSRLRYLASFFSCRRYSELASRGLDAKLSHSERRVFLFHHGWCLVCRRFRRQLLFIDQAGDKLEMEALKADLTGGGEKLSAELSARIKAALKGLRLTK